MMPENCQDDSKPLVCKTSEKNARLNVILITLDAFRYDLFVRNLESLPNMEELKDRGIFFENAFSIGPSTSFAFPGIIGGVYPYHFGIGIDENVESIDEALKNYGYNTAFINEANALLTPFFGYAKNVDYQNHFLNLSHAEADRKLRDGFIKGRDDKKVSDPSKLEFLVIKYFYKVFSAKFIIKTGKYFFYLYKFIHLYLTSKTESLQERKKLYQEFRNEILAFIDGRFRSPQFLWIHTIINHLPYFPPEASDKFNMKEMNYLNYRGISGFVSHEICKKLKILYIESMKRTDRLIGDIIGVLKANNLMDNSIIVLTSDHGEEFMEEGYFGHEIESSSDIVLHVPLLFYSPNMLKHKVISAPVSTIDIFPTLCGLLGFKIPDSNRGTSLKEILLQETRDSEQEQKLWQRPIFSEAWAAEGLLDRNPGYNSIEKVFTIRKGQYKLKVIREPKHSNIFKEKLELVDWIDNEILDIESNSPILEELMSYLYNHIHVEGIFSRHVHSDAEKRRIKRVLSKVRNKM